MSLVTRERCWTGGCGVSIQNAVAALNEVSKPAAPLAARPGCWCGYVAVQLAAMYSRGRFGSI
jgi:hypothetical protein